MKRVHLVVGLAGWLLSAGCMSLEEQRARKIVEPASMPYALLGDGPGAAAVHKLTRRYDLARTVKAPDGVELAVWVINSRKEAAPARTAVLLHPLLASKTWLLSLGNELANRGWTVVLPDLRAHGSSGGKYVTWGAKEKHDVKAIVDSLAGENLIRGDLYVFGTSAGAAAAIQYAAIDPRCRGVVAAAPPQSCREISRRILLADTAKDQADALARAAVIAEFDPNDASAQAAAAKLACPLILVHGTIDVIVPFEHGRAVFNAASGPKRLVPLPGEGHAPEIARTSWLADRVDELASMAPASRPAP